MAQGDVVIDRDSYNGNPTIVFCWADDDRYPFSFGVGKAKLLRAALRTDPNCLDNFINECDSKRNGNKR